MKDLLKYLGLKENEVRLVEYQPLWADLYRVEAQTLRSNTSDHIIGIEHIGSTYIKHLKSKPILDIMLGIDDYGYAVGEIDYMSEIGYICMGEFGIPGRLFFKKVVEEIYTTHHLHLCQYGSEFWHEHLLFRDYLCNHKEVSEEYQKLKESLSLTLQNNRKIYTESKSDFIESVISKAKLSYHESG